MIIISNQVNYERMETISIKFIWIMIISLLYRKQERSRTNIVLSFFHNLSLKLNIAAPRVRDTTKITI